MPPLGLMEADPLCRTLQVICRSWSWFPGALLFTTGGPWQQLSEVSSLQMSLAVVCILSPGLHLAPTSHPWQYLVPCTKHFRGSDVSLGMLSELVLSCVFQEAAVYGEHIWFETSVSGDFCYVGEQNCMAKLLVSHLGPPDSPAMATNPAVLSPCGETAEPTLLLLLLLGHMQGSGELPRQGLCPSYLCILEGQAPSFCQYWFSVCNGNLIQECRLPRGFQKECVGIPHPWKDNLNPRTFSTGEK